MRKLGTGIRMRMIAECCNGNIGSDAKVLDIGAGNGYVSNHIKNKFGCKMYCADILNYLEYDFPFYKISGNKLPFKDKFFDMAMINDTLHHMDSSTQIAMLKEAARVAKKVLIFETKRTFTAMVLDRIMSKIHNISMPVPCTHKTVKGWKECFLDLGLKDMEIKIEKKWYYPLNHICFIVNS
ncbi:class I SAM-dependent methyltransferase [Candidatus Woesearchaeota archaeon]|nr:class I SAM-dependent methyltransferase [Candidatus Woesearchaeota archaeon]